MTQYVIITYMDHNLEMPQGDGTRKINTCLSLAVPPPSETSGALTVESGCRLPALNQPAGSNHAITPCSIRPIRSSTALASVALRSISMGALPFNPKLGFFIQRHAPFWSPSKRSIAALRISAQTGLRSGITKRFQPVRTSTAL